MYIIIIIFIVAIVGSYIFGESESDHGMKDFYKNNDQKTYDDLNNL